MLSVGKVLCITFAAIMLVHGLFFFYSAEQYIVSRLTSLWYQDRMLPEGVKGREARLCNLKSASPQRYDRMRRRAAQLALDNADMKLVNDKIDITYYDVGMGKSYVRATMDFFKAAGTISAYAVYYIISLPLKIFFVVITQIEKWTCNVAGANG